MTYRWHKLLDDFVEMLSVWRAVRTATEIQGKFSQRKDIPSAVSAIKTQGKLYVCSLKDY